MKNTNFRKTKKKRKCEFLDFILWLIPKYQTISLIETTASQIISYDNISNSVEHKLNIISVCGTRHMTVNFLWCWFILCFELCLNVGGCFSIFLSSYNRINWIYCVIKSKLNHIHFELQHLSVRQKVRKSRSSGQQS